MARAGHPDVTRLPRFEVDGREVGADAAASMEERFGHFTAMQVRGGRTRGMQLHLARLEEANRELFDDPFDRERVMSLIRHALDEVRDGSLRVYVLEGDPAPVVLVTVKEPAKIRSPQRLRSVRYQRPKAHLKHLATRQAEYRASAQESGFDDALLTADDGTISESATANIGFFDDAGVVWPDAALLQGITMQLLERHLPGYSVASRRAPVTLRDVSSFGGAFLTSARGIAAVSGVDDVRLPDATEVLVTLSDAYDAVPWDAI